MRAFDIAIGFEAAPFVFGTAALACQVIWPIFRSRRAILATQFGIGAGYGLQYAALDAPSAASIAWIGATQTVCAGLFGGRMGARLVGCIFFPAVAIASIATWSGMVSLLAMMACSFVMLGRLQQCTLRLRLLQLAAFPFGLAHDILTCAWPALIGALVSLVVASSALRRELRARPSACRRAESGLGAKAGPEARRGGPWRRPAFETGDIRQRRRQARERSRADRPKRAVGHYVQGHTRHERFDHPVDRPGSPVCDAESSSASRLTRSGEKAGIQTAT